MHRFIPELISNAGFSMAEVPVSHRPRVAGQSKYGLSRTFRVILDLMTILFLRHYGDRPMHFSARSVSFQVDWVLYSAVIGVDCGPVCPGGLDGFNATTIVTAHYLVDVLLSIIGVRFDDGAAG